MAGVAAATGPQALECVGEGGDVMLRDSSLRDRPAARQTKSWKRQHRHGRSPAPLLAADGRDELKKAAREQGWRLLTKPVKPASLRAFLSAQVVLRRNGG